MNFIANLKLAQKLTLLVTLPILIMLAFAAYQSILAIQLRTMSSQLEHMVKFSILTSNLVHESQKERGMSAGYLGSKGAKFSTEIITQRKITDQKLTLLKDYLADFDATRMSHTFAEHLDKFLSRMAGINNIRNSITALQLPLSEALSFYTGSNAAALKLIEEMATLAPEQEIAIMISGYANYLQGKERAGIERAVLTNTFSRNKFSDGMFQKFLKLVTEQETYVNSFLAFTSAETLAEYKKVMNNPQFTEVARMRAIALSTGKRTDLINKLNIAVGYGGMIHRFKNYVLRSKNKDLAKVIANTEVANKILDQYNNLSGISTKVRADIKTVRTTINEYRKAAETVATMKKSGTGVQEIDNIVKISDGPALAAIKRLGEGHFDIDPSHWFETITAKINLLKNFEDQLAEGLAVKATSLKSSATFNLITITIISLIGLLVSMSLSTIISKNLRHQIGGEPSDIEEIANKIAEGSLEEKRLIGTSSGVYASIMTMQNKLSTVINEIQNIVDSARQGDLSNRIELDNKSGFYKSLGSGVNDLVNSSDSIINDTVRVFSSLAKGDLNQTITTEYHGSFNQLKEDANATVAKLKQVIEGDIQSLVDTALQGDLSKRIELSDKEGFFNDMSSGINRLVDSVNNIFNDASTAMRSMADGDLTQPIKNDYLGQFDELKNNINETMRNLDSTVNSLRESSDVITSTAQEISDGNNSLSSRTEHQASALEQTAASMEELTSTVKNNANNAHQADQLATNAKLTAVQGGDVMQQASSAMEEINQSSQKIAEIISVIDEIAFQTNLLALNASVEAARAGEQGRGFAVVATEVRNLAGRSATAAKEIKDLINDSVSKVQSGVNLVQQSTKSQGEIIESITRVGSIIAEISTASQEQSEGIEQVNTAVTSMDDVTQQNAALAEETSAAAVSMSDQAGEMSQMMNFFTVTNSSSPQTHSVKRKATNKPATMAQKSVAAKAPVPDISDDDEWEEF